MISRRLVALALIGGLLAGCAGVDPSPHSDVTARDSAVKLVEEPKANLILHVSNQSFDDQEVRLTVTVDGVTVVDDDFHVEDQHNWVSFHLAVPPGRHELRTASDSGATLRVAFEVPRGMKRWAVVDHWGEDESAELTWLFRRTPVGFL